jgi:hypothetical protein
VSKIPKVCLSCRVYKDQNCRLQTVCKKAKAYKERQRDIKMDEYNMVTARRLSALRHHRKY